MVALSGGIDSTSVLYQLLKAGEQVLVLHIRLRNREGREPYEAKAVQQILDWFRRTGLDTFEYLEMGFDYGDVTRLTSDTYVVGFMSGIVLSNVKYNSVKRILLTTSKTDAENPGIADQGLRKRITLETARAPGAEGVPFDPNREIAFEEPNLHKTKAQVMRELPPDLLALCWYCRFPTPDGTPCQKCHTCLDVRRGQAEAQS